MTASFREAQERSTSHAGIGLGLRWDFLEQLVKSPALDIAFLEISPENYMQRGGAFPAALETLREIYPFVTHGLTMSVGAVDPPDERYLDSVRGEIARVRAPFHSDHLCLSTAGPLILHELLPLGLTKKNAKRASERILAVEDALGTPFLVENITFYAHPEPPELSEADFLCEVLERSGAGLLLDVNNLYVNSENHGYDPQAFLRQLPLERVVMVHVAGHSSLPASHPAAPLLLDTHSAPVAEPVKALLGATLRRTGPLPVLLEWDNEVPRLEVLLEEMEELRRLYDASLGAKHAEP